MKTHGAPYSPGGCAAKSYSRITAAPVRESK